MFTKVIIAGNGDAADRIMYSYIEELAKENRIKVFTFDKDFHKEKVLNGADNIISSDSYSNLGPIGTIDRLNAIASMAQAIIKNEKTVDFNGLVFITLTCELDEVLDLESLKRLQMHVIIRVRDTSDVNFGRVLTIGEI